MLIINEQKIINPIFEICLKVLKMRENFLSIAMRVSMDNKNTGRKLSYNHARMMFSATACQGTAVKRRGTAHKRALVESKMKRTTAVMQ